MKRVLLIVFVAVLFMQLVNLTIIEVAAYEPFWKDRRNSPIWRKWDHCPKVYINDYDAKDPQKSADYKNAVREGIKKWVDACACFWIVNDPKKADVTVEWVSDPSQLSNPNWIGEAIPYPSGNKITGAKVKLSKTDIDKKTDLKEDEIKNLVTHEFGHVLGLGHTPDTPNTLPRDDPNAMNGRSATDEQKLSQDDINGLNQAFVFPPLTKSITKKQLSADKKKLLIDVTLESKLCDLKDVEVTISYAYRYEGIDVSGSVSKSLPSLTPKDGKKTVNFEIPVHKADECNDWTKIAPVEINGGIEITAKHPTDSAYQFIPKGQPLPLHIDEEGKVELMAMDFGNAPDPPYATVPASNGAAHVNTNYEWLGDYPFYNDGITFFQPYVSGIENWIMVNISTSGLQSLRYNSTDPTKLIYVNGWFDWNDNGDWDDSGEWAISTIVDPTTFIGNSSSIIIKFIPAATQPAYLWTRFRLDYGENCGIVQSINESLYGPRGMAQFGEVEDYLLQIYGPEAEFTVIPDTSLPDESVRFDASSSLPYWNGTHEMPITEHRWNFGDGNKTTTFTPIVYHGFSSSGIYYVTLTVYALGATPETDTISHKVTVISVPVGGYSIPIKGYTTEKPLTLYLALIAILTASFTIAKRRKKQQN